MNVKNSKTQRVREQFSQQPYGGQFYAPGSGNQSYPPVSGNKRTDPYRMVPGPIRALINTFITIAFVIAASWVIGLIIGVFHLF